MAKTYFSVEHSTLSSNLDETLLNALNLPYEDDRLDPDYYLGLHYEKGIVKSSYFIGSCWLNEKHLLHISPKESSGFKKADFLQMFLDCLKHPIVSQHMGDTYKIYYDKPMITLESETKDEITPFLIMHYIHVIKTIAQKGLKKGYLKVTKNLTGKIKGKISIQQTIKQNHFKNRMDKTVCSYQIFTENCLENQILKTTLSQVSKYVYSHNIKHQAILHNLKLCQSSFQMVDKKEVLLKDFVKIKHSPFYGEYKEALNLAKVILMQLGFNLHQNKKMNSHKIYPYYINMPELFERYVEVKLREEYKNDLLPGYGQKDGNSYNWSLRPDFIVLNSKMIIDAKYKYWFEDCNDCIKLKDDFQQLSLYGRVNDIRKKIELNNDEEAVLVFIYPSYNKKDTKLNFTEDEDNVKEKFSNIKKIPIYIPYLGEN